MSPEAIHALAEASDVSLACLDGEILTAGIIPEILAMEIAEHRQDLAVYLMAQRGDYDPEPCAHELRVLKALQGCITTDLAALDGDRRARMACETAHQALADIQRLATTYRWLSKPGNAGKSDYHERLKWAGHAALRLVSAASELDSLARPAAMQAVLL